MAEETQELTTIELSDGRLIAYLEVGEPDGEPILYFHGFPGSRLEVGHFHEVAVVHHCRVIGVDRPGMGGSSIDEGRSVLDWAGDVAEFADALGLERFSIIGYSGGALYVPACAYVLSSRIKSAVIVSGAAPFEHPNASEGMTRGQRFIHQLIKTFPCLTNVMMWLTRMGLRDAKMIDKMLGKLPEVDRAFFQDMQSREPIIQASLEAFKAGIGGPVQEMKLLYQPCGFPLEDITVPVTIYHGGADKQVPLSHPQIYEETIPGARLTFFENEGHHSLIRNKAEVILQGVCSAS